MKKKNKSGFTLLEMLVVVLIIGILAGIALPQYQKAVEKAKLTEALLNIKTIQGAAERYILAQGYPTSGYVPLKDFPDVELSGGEWASKFEYITRDFTYYAQCLSEFCDISAIRNVETYYYGLYIYLPTQEQIFHSCFTGFTDMGKYICKYLESQSWEYIDNEL